MTELATDSAALSSRAPRWPRVRFALLLTTLVLLVLYVGLDWWAGRQLQSELTRFRARVTPELIAEPAPVPAVDNRARLIRAAAALTVPAPPSARSAMNALGTSNAPAKLPDDLKAFAASNEPAMRLLSDFGSRHQTNWEAEGVPYLDVRTLGNALYVEALLDLEAGHTDDAVREIGRGLAVASSLRHRPDLIGQLIRIAVGAQPLDAVQRLLTQTEPSKAALEDLARWLAESRSPDPTAFALVGEASQMGANFDEIERGHQGSAGVMSVISGPLGRIFRPLVRLAHAKYLRMIGILIDAQTGPRPHQPFPILDQPSWWSPIDRLMSFALPGLERTMLTSDEYLTSLAATEIAVALRRYRIDHGSYPDQLSALVPAYLAKLPNDMFTGQPPVYARVESGFELETQRSEPQVRRQSTLAEWRVPK